MEPSFELSTYYPIFIYLAILIGFCIAVMIMAHTLGPWRQTPVKQMTYESGMDPIGDAHQRFDVKYYVVAIMFLVFDVELLFLYPWAVVAYGDGGYPADFIESHLIFWSVLVFIALLLIGYLYDWKKGVFRWR
jgi:NADH:ubiquinone oxidoreductase subunit 3 (subunit A)